MIAEGAAFADFIENTLYRQKVYDFCLDTRLSGLFESSTNKRSDVVFANDHLWRLGIMTVDECFQKWKAPRAIVSEVIKNHTISDYIEVAERRRYKFYRCLLKETPIGCVTVMEFHRTKSI